MIRNILGFLINLIEVAAILGGTTVIALIALATIGLAAWEVFWIILTVTISIAIIGFISLLIFNHFFTATEDLT